MLATLALVLALAGPALAEPGLILTPSTLNLEETGTAKTYSLQMADTCDPDVDECVGNLLLSNPDGSRQFTFTPDIIRWFANTWTEVKTVTVTPTDNQIHDAQNAFSISHNVVSQTGTPLFPAVALTVTITNDDQSMLIVTAPAAVQAIEGGAGADVKVRLATEPVKTVTVTVAVAGSEVTVSTPSLTFSSSTWNVEQTATLEVSNDALAAATRTLQRLVRITASSTDPFYSNVAEVQQVKLSGSSAIGGTVTLTFNSYVTVPISVSATATAVKTALEALDNVYAVSVTRAANAENGFTWLVTFTENAGDLPALIVDTGSMTGSGATAAVTTTRAGVPPYSPAFSGEFFITVIDDDLKVRITDITAADTGNQPGPGNADSMTLRFSEDTNRPAVGTKSAIDALFSFSTVIGTSYSGAWALVDVPSSAVVGVTSGSTLVTAGADVTNDLASGDEIRLNGVQYTIASVAITGGTAQSPTSTITLSTAYAGASGNVGAQMRSRSRLVITLDDTTGITSQQEMRVGTLSVTIKSTGALSDRYGASSAAVSTTVVSLGTWGALNPPQVVSAAATTHGNQAGMGPLDRIVVTFDSDTDRAGYANTQISKANVDKLVTFTFGGDPVSLGDAYTGTWESDSKLRITLVDTTSASSQRLTRVGGMLVAAATGNNIKSFDATSGEATGSATLSGDWGAQAAPTISSMVAANAVAPFTPTAGISVGDTVTITFNAPTSMPAVGSKADIATWLSFTGNMGSTYSGVWQNDGTVLLITLADLSGKSTEDLTAVGTLTASVTALLKSADQSSPVSSSSRVLSGTWGARTAPAIETVVARDPAPVVGGLSEGDRLLVTFNVDVNVAGASSAVATLFDFRSPSVAGTVWDVTTTDRATGTWLNARQYEITVGSNIAGIDFAETRVDHMIVAVRAGGVVKTLDGSSPASTSTRTLTGTWGARAAPTVTTAVASDAGGQSGLGVNDRLTITFNVDTDRAAGTVEPSVTSLISFSSPLGNTVTGTWSSRKVLVVTVTDITGTGPIANTRVGTLTVTMLAAGDLRTSDRSSPASTAGSGTTGTWGNFAAPQIVTAEAVDPVSSLASAGFTNGDTLRLTFDITTNRAVAASMTKTQVNSLLTFTNGGTAVNMGDDYTGSWSSAKVLVITMVDTTNAEVSRTTVGALRVTVRAAAGLVSEDLSSPASTSSALVSGTWGDFPAPAIATATASNAGNQEGLGVGDTLTLVFDQSTNKAGSATDSLTRASVDALLEFSARIGSEYTGQWTAADTLVLTVVTADVTVPPRDTAVGTMYVKVKLAAGLRSADASSAASESVGLVDLGTWGARTAPTLQSVVASDAGSNEGIGNNDRVVLTFTGPTTQQANAEVQTVTTSASAGSSVGGVFRLSYRGAQTADIDKEATAATMQTRLQALPSVGTGGVTVTRAAAANGFTWTVTFTTSCRYGIGDLPSLVADTSGLIGVGASVTVTETVKGGQATGSNLANLVSFSSSLGASVSGTWTTSTTLQVTIEDVTGASAFNTRIGALTANVLAAGGLKSSDKSSAVITASNAAVTGTWGAHSAPSIDSALAADPAPVVAGISASDTLTITFNKETNQPAQTGTGKAGVASLFTLSSELGADYSGAWASSTQFVITIADATGASIRNTRIGTLQVTVAGAIKSADLSSSDSTASRTASGTWGDHSKPLVTAVTALDIAPVVKGISNADVIDVTFDKDTNQPSGTVGDLFTVSSSLGATASGAWTSATVYRITLTSVTGADPAATRVGLLTVTARASALIKSADESSPAADNGGTLGGSWGDHDAPVLVSATAADTGVQPGVGVGDTLTLVFDIAVNRVASASETVSALVSTSASIGSGLTGTWVDNKTFRITITDDTGKGTILATQVGVMTATIKAGANVLSADLSSPVSTSSATVSGDWGQFPSPEIASAVAADPVSSPATAGLSSGDTLTLRFTMDTNQPAVATTTDVNNLLLFSATVGTTYTGTWVTARQLRIDFSDTGGSNVVDTRVNHLTVTVRASGNLRSSDGSSPASTSSQTVTGSWGPFAKPAIQSMTAGDGAPTQGGIGDGDTVTILFSSATNTPALADAAAINSLFTFNAPIATSMSGTWTDSDLLVIKINTVHPDAAGVNAGDTRVGGLFVKVEAAGGLRSADFSSPAADGFGFLDSGSWGDRAAPVVSSVVAANTANNEGIAVGDTFTVNFDAPTSGFSRQAQQTVTTSASTAVGGTFRLTYKGWTSADVSAAATSGELVTALEALPVIGTGGVTVSRSTADAGLGTFVWTVTFTSTCRSCSGSVPAMVPTSLLAGTGANVAVAVVTRGDTLIKATIDTLLGFTSPLGDSYTGQWASSASQQLVVTLVNLNNAGHVATTVPGTLQVTVKAAAGLVSADRSSGAASGTVVLGGTWGVHTAPVITSAVASNGGLSAGINVGDTVTVHFNKMTNQPTAYSDLVTLSPPQFGRDLTFSWQGDKLIIIMGAVTGAGYPVDQTRVGLAQVTVNVAGNARSADLTSPAASGTVTLSGSWGDHPAPTIVSATAADGASSTPGIGVGDTITVVFDQVTNVPTVDSASAIASLLTFSAVVGTFNAAWTDTSTLVLTITGVQPGDETPAVTRVGTLRIGMASGNPLRSADLSSPEGTGSKLLGGTWGQQDPPLLQSAVATDTGNSPGLNTGDRLTLTFDRSTNKAPRAGPHLDHLIAFSALVGPVSGTWTDRRTLRITFLDTSARAPPQDVVAGVLSVLVLAPGGLRSADESSVNATAAATLVTGSFGVYPAPTLVSAVASDTGNQQGIGVGDSYLLTFSIKTDAPTDPAVLNQLVRWTASPGALIYTWVDTAQLRVTITSQAAASPAHLTRVGLLEVSVKSDATFMLRSADASSPGADTAAVVTGTYGPHDPPGLVSVAAADTGNSPGQNAGDSILVTFNKATNVPALGGSPASVTEQKRRVDGVFVFSATLGTWYRGTWNTVALAGTGSVIRGSTRVVASASVQGSLAAVGSPVRIGTFDTTIASFANSSVFTIADAYDGSTADFVPMYGESRTTALLTVTNTSTSDPYETRVGGLRMAVRQLAGLRSSDLTSEPSVVEKTLSGSWGPHSRPVVTGLVASDVDQEPGVGTGLADISNGDTLTISFDQATNAPELANKAQVDAVLNFSAPIGSQYLGSWLTKRLDGVVATPVVGAKVLSVSADVRRVLKRGTQFRVGLTLLQVATSGAYTANSIPLEWAFPAAAVSMTQPVRRVLEDEDAAGTRSLATAADTVAAQRSVYIRDPSRVIIVILDATGAGPPSATTPRVLNVGVRTLLSADESSPPVDALRVVTGSWNPAPVIVSATANHGATGTISHGLDTGDFALIVFNVETTMPQLGNRTMVDNVFGFSASLGADYTGVWLNPSVAKVTVVDASGAATESLLRAGTLLVRVKEGASLKARVGDSGSSLSVAAMVGLWGSELRPEMVTVTAVNGDNAVGVGPGDEIRIGFNHDTNMAPVSKTPEVQTITLTSTPVQAVQVVALTGAGITGFFKLGFKAPGSNVVTATSDWIATTAVATKAHESGGAYGIGLGESLQSRLQAMDGVGIVTVSSRINGATGGKEWTITFTELAGDVPDLTVAQTDLSFPIAASGLGAGVEVRRLVTGLTLGGYITVTMDGAAESGHLLATADSAAVAAALQQLPEVDGVAVGVFSIGPGGSVEWTITFTANVGQLPQLAIAQSALTGSSPTVAVATLVEGVTSKGQLVSMFDTSAVLPEEVSAHWLSARELAITLHQASFTAEQAAALASLRVAVKEADAVLRSAGGTVSAFGGGQLHGSGGGVLIGGSFGLKLAPVIVSAEAQDGSGTPGIAVGDRLVVTFNVDTNRPTVATADDVDRVLHMTAALGCDYEGVWTSLRTLVVTVTNVACTDVSQTAVGTLVVTVRGATGQLRTSDLTSLESESSATLSGSWGDHAAPKIVSVTAFDAEDQPVIGVSEGDTVHVVFDVPVARPWDVADTAVVATAVAFSESLGANVTGEWAWEAVSGTAVLSEDRSHLLFTSRANTRQLGPGTEIRFGGLRTRVASTPTVFSVGPLWPLSSEQLGNPATVSRILRTTPMGVLPLTSALPEVPGCAATEACSRPVETLSRTTMVLRVADPAGAVGADAEVFAEVGHTGSAPIRTADRSSPAAAERTRVQGTFGATVDVPWYELWWVWFIICMAVLLAFCIGFWWVCLKRNYIMCFKNNPMGGVTYQPKHKTVYNGQRLQNKSLATGEALHAYTTTALDPAVISKAVSGFKRSNKRHVKRGAARFPSTAPNVMVHSAEAPPTLPPIQRSSGPRAPGQLRPLHERTRHLHDVRSRSSRPIIEPQAPNVNQDFAYTGLRSFYTPREKLT